MKIIKWKANGILLLIIGATIILLIWRFTIPAMNLKSTVQDTSSHHITNSQDVQDEESFHHKLAVIVPFRDRFEELLEFVPHMHSFLKNASINHRILVVNQADKLRFNRAALINIGYLLSISDCDYMAMHDVDLLPLNPALDYGYPDGYAYHVAAPYLHPLYHYDKFVGGILLLTHQDFQSLNGLSNRYWGWGREDDEFYVRMARAQLTLRRPSKDKIKTGYSTFRHIHDKIKRPRDNQRYGDQRASGGKPDQRTGLHTVGYKLADSYNLTIREAPLTVYNVELECDTSDTPWCEYH